jgi:hypothetical protein
MSVPKIYGKTWASSALITLIIYYAYLALLATSGSWTDALTNLLISHTIDVAFPPPLSFLVGLIIDPIWGIFQLFVFIILLLYFWYTDDDY